METPLKQNVSTARDFLAKKQEAEQGQLVTLPSVLSIMVKRPDPAEMMLTGTITDELINDAMREDESGAKKELTPEEQKKSIDKYLELADKLIVLCCVSPRFTHGETDIDANVVSIKELTLSDRMFLARHIMSELNGENGKGDSENFPARKTKRISKK